MTKQARLLLLLLALAPGLAGATKSYEFSGEGEALLAFMSNPPHGTDYCSLRFYMNQQSIIYAISYKPGAQGLQVGDRVVSINGITIEGPPSIPAAIGPLSSKDKLQIIVDREGKPVQIERACSDDTAIDKTIKSLATAIVAEDWGQCRSLVKKVEQHERRAEWINIRMRCNYMYAESKNNLAAYWNRDWPYDTYQYYRARLKAASWGSMAELEALRPDVIQAISDLSRNNQRMFSGDLSNDFSTTTREVQLRNGLLDPEEE